MTVIGLFSVIESLVSHGPKLTESADSLSHQIRTKLPLLRKRFYPELEGSGCLPRLQEEATWNKLYAYRSKIVHGEDSQISGDLQALKNVDSVIGFLLWGGERMPWSRRRRPCACAANWPRRGPTR